ncbi:MAG: acyl carrier protein [Bacteroidales bacterium]
MDTTKQKIIDILKKYTFNDEVWEGYNDDYHVVKDLKINSARMVDIILDIEDEFGVEITDEELDQMNSVRDMLNLLKEKMH